MRRSTPDLSTLAIIGWATMMGGLILFVLSLTLGESIAGVRWNRTTILAVAYSGLLVTPIIYFVYFEFVRIISPVRVSFLVHVSPVVTAIAWILLEEGLPPPTLIGFIIITTEFVLAHR